MEDVMDFIGHLFVLGIIISMFGVFAVVGFCWNNKGKILMTIGAAIAGYILYKKNKANSTMEKDINTIDVTPNKI